MGISQQNVLHQLVSFLLGASAAAVLLFFLSSAGRAARPAAITSWANGATAIPPVQEANLTSDADHAVQDKPGQAAAAAEQDLEQLLRAVADEHRTVIMTAVNEAWAAEDSLLDLFLESFRTGERIAHFAEHLLVVALDGGAFERCRAVHPHCYLLANAGGGRNLSDEKVFMSADYIDLVWSKVRLQQRILELGYNFLFTDVDILWFRDPFERVSVAAHMATSSDFYFGEPYSPANLPNTGLLYARASRRTAGAFAAWVAARASFPGRHEQQVLNEIKGDLVARRGLRIQFLDTDHVAGFCNNTRDFNTLYTMHANCCVGLAAKLHDLANLLREWRAYRAMDDADRRRGPARWTVPGICIH